MTTYVLKNKDGEYLKCLIKKDTTKDKSKAFKVKTAFNLSNILKKHSEDLCKTAKIKGFEYEVL